MKKNSILYILHCTLKRGFTLFEFLIVLILAAILGFAVYQTIDPAEQKNKQRDQEYKDEASAMLDVLVKYGAKYEKMPWDSATTSALPWTHIADAKVGFCAGSSCSPGGLSEFEGLPGSVQSKTYVSSQDESERMLVAKNPKGQAYMCFLPKSKTFRLNWVDLKDIRPGEQIPKSGEPLDCPAQPDWNQSSCYFCVSKKVNP